MAIRYLSGINVDSNTLFVDSTNNRVGIGTTSPEQKFHLQGSNLMATFQNSDTSANQYTQLEFVAGSRSAYIWLGNQNSTNWAGDGGLNIYTTSGNMDLWTAASQRIRITSGGNVLIGTTTDAGYKLDVNGVGRFSSGVQVPNGQYFQTIRNSGGLLINLLGIDAGTDNTRLLITGDFDIRNGSLTSLMNMTAAGTTTFSASQLIIANANASVYFTNGSADYGNGSAIGRASTNGYHIGGSIAGDLCIGAEYGKGIIFGTGASGTLTQRMKIDTTGSIRFNSYGSGSFTGTVAYNLAVDSSGNIIETAGGVVDGSGTANYVSKWSDANTLTDSQLFDNGTNVGIGTTSPNAQLDAFTTQGGSTIAATHGTGGTYPKASGISFGATSTSLSVSNNGGTVVFTGGAGIYANNGAASNNPTELVFWTTSAGSPAARLTIASTGATRLNAYGSGSFTGTVAYNLAVDSSGNIIETAGGVVDGSGTANMVAKWSDANTLTDSGIEDTSSSVSIGRAAFYSPSNYGIYYSALTGASSGTAWYDTITGATGPRVYNMVVRANPNADGSGSYADFYFGKVFVGTGYNGSAVVHFINYQQESQMPRSLYGSGGGNLTITAFFVVGGTESTEVANGATYTIRIKIAGYGNAGAGTEITLQRIM